MLHDVCRVTLLLLAAAPALTGCRPPVEQGGRVMPGVTYTGLADPDTRSENDPPGSETPAPSEAAAAIDDAVLYDSGYEEDNSSCMVCHIDFEAEEISLIHLDAGLTCMACHGDSDDHRSDEFNVVRPDVIWGRTEQDAFCMQCHKQHKDPEKVEAFHQEWDARRRPNGRYVEPESVCMDCHGNHAITLAEGQFK